MKVSIITLFPNLFEPVFHTSILDRAREKGMVEFELVDLRLFGEGKHKSVDGRPYGGGAGMILRSDILAKALKSVSRNRNQVSRVLLTSPVGQKFDQKKARSLSKIGHLIIICGHYEGVDQRFVDHYIDEEISIGDYVLTGGELPAMVIVDSVVRLLPGVLKKEEASLEESFENGLLEYPHFTRPDDFEGVSVPEVLKSGNHQEIEKWRDAESLKMTAKKRPDLLKRI